MSNDQPNQELSSLIHWVVTQMTDSDLVEQLDNEHLERIVQLIFCSQLEDPTLSVDDYVDHLELESSDDTHYGAMIFAEVAMALYFDQKKKGAIVELPPTIEPNEP